MWQEIISWVIVAVCVFFAVRTLVRRFRGKGKSGDCGCGSSAERRDSCAPSTDVCLGCAMADLCRKPEKKS